MTTLGLTSRATALIFSTAAFLFAPACKSKPKTDSATAKAGSGGIQQILQIKGATLTVPLQNNGAKTPLTGTVRPSGIIGVSEIYSFGPEGRQFDPPATLTVQLSTDDNVSAIEDYLALHKADGSWERLTDSVAHPGLRLVSASVSHFSEYAVLSGSPGVSGIGTTFQSSGVTVTGSSPIAAALVASPRLIELSVARSVAQTFFVAGLAASTPYFIYINSYSNPPSVLTTDNAGSLRFDFSAATPAVIKIQPKHGTVILPLQCDGIPGFIRGYGTVDGNGCDLDVDPGDGIEIVSGAPTGYTLHCNTSISGNGGGTGVTLSGKGSSIDAPAGGSCQIHGFGTGIDVPLSNYCTNFLFNVNTSSYSCSDSDATASSSIMSVGIFDVDIGVDSTTPGSLTIEDSSITANASGRLQDLVSLFALSIPLTADIETFPVGNVTLKRNEFRGADVIFQSGLNGPSIFSHNVFAGVQIVPVSSNIFSANFGFDTTTSLDACHNDFQGDLVVAASNNTDVQNSKISVHDNQFDAGFGTNRIVLGPCNGCSIWDNGIDGGVVGIEVDDDGAHTSQVDPKIYGNFISDVSIGIQLFGSTAQLVPVSPSVGNRVSAGIALQLVPASNGGAGCPTASLNDFVGSDLGVFSGYSANGLCPQLTPNNVGNYWGHDCASGPPFFGVSDTLDPTVVDSNPWGVSVTQDGAVPLSQLLLDGPPGCQTIDCAETNPTTVLLLKR